MERTFEAGRPNSGGYLQIRIEGRSYFTHRIIWFLEKGTQPKFVDHINGIRNDNRIINLRESTRRENQQNMHIHRSGKLVGATYSKREKKWVSQITINKRKIYLGLFKTELEAHNAYMEALSMHLNELPQAELDSKLKITETVIDEANKVMGE